jgi:4-amino-4-deoxy-L-arabinose transferase-like glycosyltransferase
MPDGEHAESTGARARWDAAALVAAGLLLACHFVFLMHYYEPAISTIDSHGYFVQARQLADTGDGAVDTESRVQYVGRTWKSAGRGRYVSMWPPGLPLVLAGARRAFGPGAMFLVNPVLATLCLLAVFLVGRAWFGAGWGLLGAALLGCLPFVNEHAFYGYSHIAVMFFMVWGLFFTVQWVHTRGAWWALAAGVCAGFLACIRYPAALFAVAFGVYGVLCLARDRRAWPGLAAFTLGAGVPVIELCIYNGRVFGTFGITGYSLIGYSPTTLFKWEAFKVFAPAYVQQLLAVGAGYAFVLGVAGIVFLCAQRAQWRRGLLMGLLVLPATLLYMAYPQMPHEQSMRFLLPTLPVYVIASCGLLAGYAKERPIAGAALGGVLLVLTAAWGMPLSVKKMQAIGERQAVLARVAREVKRNVPRGSVLIADEMACHDLDVYGWWRLACTTALSRDRVPLYGDSRGDALYEAFLADAGAWAGSGRDMYWLGNDMRSRGLAEFMRRHYTLDPVAEIPVMPAGWDKDMLRRATAPPEQNARDAAPAWVAPYNMSPAPEEFMERMFYDFAGASPVRLYKLTRMPRAEKGADQ